MQTLPLSKIWVSEKRQRTFFNEERLASLYRSISGPTGLLNAIVVRQDGMLLAGENRLRVLRSMIEADQPFFHNGHLVPPGEVPVTYFRADATPADQFRAEFEENEERTPLTWQERAEALATLHAHLGGTVAETTQQAYPNSTVGGAQRTAVRNAIIVAKHLNRKDIANAASLEEALQILEREEEIERRRAAGTLSLARPPHERHTLIHGSCLDVLANYTGEPFKCVITDPPYGIGANNPAYARLAGTALHHYDDSPQAFVQLMRTFAPLLAAVTDPKDAHVWLFCDVRRFGWLSRVIARAGFYVYPFPVIRQYGGAVGKPFPKVMVRRDYDALLFAMRGDRPTRGLLPDVLPGVGRLPPSERLDFGPQKPIATYKTLLNASAEPGWSVLDPFAGSGTLIPAAHTFGANAYCVEQELEAFGLAAKRLAALDDQKGPK